MNNGIKFNISEAAKIFTHLTARHRCESMVILEAYLDEPIYLILIEIEKYKNSVYLTVSFEAGNQCNQSWLYHQLAVDELAVNRLGLRQAVAAQDTDLWALTDDVNGMQYLLANNDGDIKLDVDFEVYCLADFHRCLKAFALVMHRLTKAILAEHQYDGPSELKFSLPPLWLKYEPFRCN